MDESEFRRLLDLFPVVRSPDYHIDLDSSRQSSSQPAQNDSQREWQDAWNEGDKKEKEKENLGTDAFWGKLKLAAAKKVGEAEAEKFCEAFQRIHKKLVFENLSLDAARSYLNLLSNPDK